MNNSFSLQQISRTGNLDSTLLPRHYKLNLMADFMRIKYKNPKLKQSEKANQLGYCFSTLQIYRIDINMLSSYRTQSNKRTKMLQLLILTTVRIANLTLKDLKRPQMTLKQSKQIQNQITESKNF